MTEAQEDSSEKAHGEKDEESRDSAESAQLEESASNPIHVDQRSQLESESKLKKILDDFFSQVECEAMQRAQTKKKTLSAGKEK